jgi:flavin-binding protein dodecin
MPVVKVIELVGVSTTSWEDAARQALQEAARTVKNITGLDVEDHTAKVSNGQITEYHTTVRLAFRVDSTIDGGETSTGKAPAGRGSKKGRST